LVFHRSTRGRTVLLLSAVLVTLGLVTAVTSQTPFLYAGIGLFLYYYASKLLLEVKVKALDKLEISRRYTRRISEGSKVEVVLSFVNRTFLRLNVEVLDAYPQFFRLKSGTNSAVMDVPAKGFSELSYEVEPTSLGANPFGPVRLITRDIAGLFFYERTAMLLDTVEVTPQEKEIIRGALTASAISTYAGSLISRRKGEGMEFADIRQYTPGDPYKRIEWSSTARTGHVMVRELHAETQLNVMVLLDATESMSYGEAGQTKLDYSARAVASLVGYLARRGDFVGLTVVKGADPAQVVPLARGQTHVTRLTRALGTISPSKGATASLTVGVRRSLALGRVKGRTLFFVITDLDTEEDLNALKQLLEMNHEVIVISPYTPLFEAHGLKGLDRVIYSINTSHEWRVRKKLVGEAARLGVPVLDVGPNDLFTTLVTRVEELRRRGGS
jgi:uncharacterized protein (DUF58 family)